MKHIPYKHYLKSYSRKLRKESTLSEVLLWKRLRAGQMRGYTFNRQKPLLSYIVDFYCRPLNLVIEIDGKSHEHKFIADRKRQKELESYGLFFLRFTDKEVKKNINNVLEVIDSWIDNYENTR